MPIFGFKCIILFKSCTKFVGNLEILYSSQIKKITPGEVKIADYMATDSKWMICDWIQGLLVHFFPA